MFKIRDIVEITEESYATGMLDFKKGKGYEVINRHSHREILLRDEGGHTDWYHCAHFKLKEDIKVEKKECLFKEGQVVWDVRYTEAGKVCDVYESSLEVQYPFGVVEYSLDGEPLSSVNAKRTLFFSEPKIEAATEPLFEPTLKYGDLVMAVDDSKSGDVIVVRKEDENVVTAETGISYWKSSNTFYRLGEKINFK